MEPHTPLHHTPSLEIVGRYTLPRYRIEAVIGGTANTPSLTLRSEPSLEPADILAILVFGRPVSALTQTDRASLQSQVLKTIVGYIAADIQQSIAQMIGVETLEFELSESMQQSRLGVGKYIAEGVFVSTWQTLGDTFAREVLLDYQFDPHWHLRGTSNSQGNSGIDLMWGKQY